MCLGALAKGQNKGVWVPCQGTDSVLSGLPNDFYLAGSHFGTRREINPFLV